MFSPREIDGALYVDGGIEGNFYYGGHPLKPEYTFGGIWKRKFPHIPIPKAAIGSSLMEIFENHQRQVTKAGQVLHPAVLLYPQGRIRWLH